MIYAYVALTVTDPETFAKYAAVAGDALAKHGGKPEAMTTEPTVIEGGAPAPGRAVLIGFPDKAAALGWINDPDLAETHALRRDSGECHITLIG